MSKLVLSYDVNEQLVQKNIKTLMKLSALKASQLLEDLQVYKSLNRLRSSEEIYHLHNFVGLENEFRFLFDILAEMNLLEKQGEFFKDSNSRLALEQKYEEEIEEENRQLFEPFHYVFDKIITNYKTIIKGEQGKLDSNELIDLIDSLQGMEFFFLLRQHFYKLLTTRIASYSEQTNQKFINWGVGSGFEAIHMADFFEKRASIISIEPKNKSYRCKVLQDLYELYNLDFIERPNLQLDDLKNSIDIFFGDGLFLLGDFRDSIKLVKEVLKEEGYLALILNSNLDLAFNWIYSIYSDYPLAQKKENIIAKLKHYGFSRVKYIGLENTFVVMQQ